MSSTGQRLLVQRKVRSPRSAAISGILCSLLIVTVIIVLRGGGIVDPAEIDRDWLEARSATAGILVLIPFAGLSFLWFTGVMRDLLGELEDKFLSTVFLGSGIILVVMMFVWAATYGAIFSTYQLVGDGLTDLNVFIYVTAFHNELIGNYLLRMGGVYMLSSSMLWIRTKVVPRWLIIVSIILAVPFLVFAPEVKWSRLLAPTWLLMVSIFILILNFRPKQQREGDEEPTLET
jgi:hypothetical protein